MIVHLIYLSLSMPSNFLQSCNPYTKLQYFEPIFIYFLRLKHCSYISHCNCVSLPVSLIFSCEFSCIVFWTHMLFMGRGSINPIPNSQPGRLGCLVWNLTLDLSGLRDPASRYTTTGIALEITGSHKPHCHDKMEMPSGRQMHLYCC